MKNNILHHFALNDLKIHKKDSMISIITIFVIAIVVMFINLVTPTLQLTHFIEHEKQYGTYDYICSSKNPDDFKDIKLRLDNKDVPYYDSRLSNCFIYSSGQTLLGEQMNSFKGDHDIMSVHIKEGKMPTNENEVAVKETVLLNWGYEKQVNDTVEFSYTLNDVAYLKEFKLVGILDSTGETDIAVSDFKYDNISLYIDKNNTDAMIRNQEHNLSTAISYELINSYTDRELSYIAVFIQLIIFTFSFSLLSGLTLSSFEKKERDYTLLRSIGATKRQMYYIIFVQSILLSVAPILLSMGIIYLVSFLLPMFISLPIDLPFPTGSILWSSFIVLMVAFISYFIPAKNACKKAITGSFDAQEFQYFYYRYKKLHQLRPFYLGWRQLVSMKKKMISKVFFIFIIVLCIMEIIGSYTIFLQVSEQRKAHILTDEIMIEFVPLDDSDSVNKDDFNFIKPYASSVDYYQYVNMKSPFYMNIGDKYYPDVYCLNDALKEKYDIDDLKDNEIILSRSYLNANDYSDYQEHDIIDFFYKSYELIKIVDNDYANIAIVNEKNYPSYGDINNYQRITAQFKSSKQRTDVYTQEYKTIAKLKEKYYLSDSYFNKTTNEQYSGQDSEGFSGYNGMDIIYASVAIAASIIYIYQFSFELMKQKEDIGSYQLLGLCKKEIRNIYFYKSLIVASVGLLCGMLYYYLECYYSLHMLSYEYMMYEPINILILISVPFIIIVIIVWISLLPLRRILKSDGLENKNARE